MRRLIEHSLMTLDGIFADPVSWGYRDYNDDERFRDGLSEVLACDAMLFGRGSFEASAPIFGQRTHAWAARISAVKKYVFSSTLKKADWNNSTIVRGDAAGEVGKLKQQDGGDLPIYGHTSLAEALFREHYMCVDLSESGNCRKPPPRMRRNVNEFSQLVLARGLPFGG